MQRRRTSSGMRRRGYQRRCQPRIRHGESRWHQAANERWPARRWMGEVRGCRGGVGEAGEGFIVTEGIKVGNAPGLVTKYALCTHPLAVKDSCIQLSRGYLIITRDINISHAAYTSSGIKRSWRDIKSSVLLSHAELMGRNKAYGAVYCISILR